MLIAMLALLAVQDNALTDAETAEGWTLLFDGKTTEGWRGYKKDKAPAGWTVVDGILTRSGGGGDLMTVAQYGDFELSIDWKVAEGGNSGIMYRVAESEGAPYMTGPEYQVLDDARHGDGKNPITSSGSIRPAGNSHRAPPERSARDARSGGRKRAGGRSELRR
jgi:hypothetical protein